jgi:hypothetical protein
MLTRFAEVLPLFIVERLEFDVLQDGLSRAEAS